LAESSRTRQRWDAKITEFKNGYEKRAGLIPLFFHFKGRSDASGGKRALC
jgi:hypothetical protein